MDQEPEFYVSPEDLEAQMTADERGESRYRRKTQHLSTTCVMNVYVIFI